MKNIEKDSLDIKMWRSQGYTPSTMAGIHKFVQARIQELNPKALLVPCTNHSLNLCGVHSFGSVLFPNITILCNIFWTSRAVSYTHLDVYKRQALRGLTTEERNNT